MVKKKTSDMIKDEIKARIIDWSERYMANFFPEATKLVKTLRIAVVVAVAVQITFIISLIAIAVYFVTR